MKPSSEKRLQQLHPALASAVRTVVADLAARGIVVEVVQGLRTYKEQDELYAKGRTKPGPIVTQARGGQSNHNFGLAVDLCPFTGDKPDWNAPMAVWAAIGAAAEARGLEWGGQWKKFLDKPHVQLPAMSVKECASCYQAGGLDAVWSTASKRIGWVDVLAAPRVRRRVVRKRPVKRAAAKRANKTRSAAARTRRARPVRRRSKP
jgi:peptidoglycan L-alanyl-D-glutamate endopeptidase CwlK